MDFIRNKLPIYSIAHRTLDVFILLLVTWFTYLRVGHPELLRLLAIFGTIFMAIIFSLAHIYVSWRSASVLRQLVQVLWAWVIVVVLLNLLILLISNKEQFALLWPYVLFRSHAFLYWAVTVYLGLILVRFVLRATLALLRQNGYNIKRAAIVGAGEAAIKLARLLKTNQWMGIQLVGFFHENRSDHKAIEDLGPSLGEISECAQYAQDQQIDIVFLALSTWAEQKSSRLIWDLNTKGVNVLMVPDIFTLGIQKARPYIMGDLHLLDLNLFPPWKRWFDILFSLCVVLLALPVSLLIALIIKFSDGGPIFYKQKRIKENGKLFNCIKFRTMHVEADRKLEELLATNPSLKEEWERSFKLKHDPRVTKIGTFLRKTSLDELPQFLNVLSGDMSVVGARPVVARELEQFYKKSTLSYCCMKPGLTGLWQVSKRSETTDYNERVELDQWYILNHSMWLDIKIILLTLWRMVRPVGAY